MLTDFHVVLKKLLVFSQWKKVSKHEIIPVHDMEITTGNYEVCSSLAV